VWDSFCSNNLAVFLPKYFERNPFARKHPPKPKIGIVAKGCDLRSMVALIKEKQAPREHLVLIGVPCQGMIDKRKVEAAIAAKTSRVQDAEIQEYSEQDGMLYVTTRSGETYKFNKQDFLQEACLECRYPMPEGVDYLIEGTAKEPGDGGYKKIEAFEAQTLQERWEYFMQEISRCIRCYACRQACPTCWCKECFAEHTDLKWIGMSTDISDTMIFHLTRIFHQAGRCVECDACYRACPMNIDLRTFTKKIGKDVESFFEFYPDFDLETIPPISTFREKDSDSFITEP
jgi:ferredoxin